MTDTRAARLSTPAAIGLLLAVLVLGGTPALAPLMRTIFLGDSGQNTFTVTQEVGPAASLDAEDAAASGAR